MNIPTTKEIADQNIARFEAELGQTVPLNVKAFLRVLSVEEAILFTSLYKYGIDRAKQVLAISATKTGLDDLGAEFKVPRKVAKSTVLTITLPGTNGTIIPATHDFVSDSTGVRYSVDASATVTGGIATISVTAKKTGTIGNLNNGEPLTIGTQVPGAETVATATATTTTGANEELDDNYRIRILDVIRAPGGGGSTADYRNWAQEVAGVVRAYPYSAGPIALLVQLPPPNRTVYVEATTAIEADGIPPQSLLDSVRDSITTDPLTGLARQPLGLTDDTLHVEAITRTAFFVQITGLIVDSSIEATVKTDINTQLTAHFRGLRPFVDGVDAVTDRNDLMTDLTVGDVVQDVLKSYGGSAQAVAFDTISGGSIPEYQLTQGEMAKLSPGGVAYV